MSVLEERDVLSYPFPPARPPVTAPSYYECRVSPLMLENCVNRYVFLWTMDIGSFWLYLTGYEPDGMLTGYLWDIDQWQYVQMWSDQVENFY